MSIEAMKQALAAHKKNERHMTREETRYWCEQYRLLCERFIQQAEKQEPIAWTWLRNGKRHFLAHDPSEVEEYHGLPPSEPVYLFPPEREPLTETFANELYANLSKDKRTEPFKNKNWFQAGIAAAESAHGIKENT